MAGKSNDFLQIVMLTFFLCAIFFAGWGGVMWLGLNSDVEARDGENTNQRALERFLKDPKNQSAWANIQREQKARAEGKENVAATIQSLVKAIPGKGLSWIKNDKNDRKDMGDNLTEVTYTVTFGPTRLKDYIYLLAKLEGEQPHIKVADLEISKKRGKNTGDDSYQGKIIFVTYF